MKQFGSGCSLDQNSVWFCLLIIFCVQAAGGGGRCSPVLSPGPVTEEPVQRTQYQLQSDDPVLCEAAGAAPPTPAGPPHLCFSLLLSPAGWGPVCPLELEELNHRTGLAQRSTLSPDLEEENN